MKLSQNIYVQGAARYLAAAAGVSFMLVAFQQTRKHISKSRGTYVLERLEDFATPEVVKALAVDDDFLDIAFRLSEFGAMTPQPYRATLKSMADVVSFLQDLPETKNGSHVKLFSLKGHEMINAIRLMRAYLELKVPSVLDDFDEVAGDIQTKYDEEHERLLFDSQLRY